MFPLITKHFALNDIGRCLNENENTLAQSPTWLKLNSHWVCDSIGLTLPLELMSYLSPIHPAHVSPRPQSVDVPALDGWLFLPEESWGCQNPCGLLGGSFSDSISWSEWVGKKSLSTMPNGRQEGKQIERRREEEEGRGGGEGEWGNTRGYYWSCAWLLNPHRAAVFQPFPLGSFKQPILLK